MGEEGGEGGEGRRIPCDRSPVVYGEDRKGFDKAIASGNGRKGREISDVTVMAPTWLGM